MGEDKKLFISFRAAVIIAVIVILIHLVLAAIATAIPSLGAPINLITSVITSGLAAAGLFYGARHSRRYGRFVTIAWALLTIAQLSDALGAVIKLVFYSNSQPLQYPSLADIIFLLFFPLLATGILFLLAALFAPDERPKLLLDAGIIILGSVQLAWAVVIGLTFAPTSPSHATELVGLTFTLIQAMAIIILAITTLKFILSWPRSLIPRPFVLLMIGVAIEILTDILFEYQTSHRIYVRGGFTEVGWTVAYAMIGLAGVLHATLSRAQSKWALSLSQLRYASSSWLHYTPLLWMVIGYFVVVWNRSHPLPIDPSILEWGMGGIVVLGIVRQLLVMRENVRLRAATQGELAERKRMEEALRRVNAELTEANQKLQELDKMKDQFVSNVSHELRTPHANIKLYLRLLEHGKPEKYVEYMQTLHREVARLEKMIDDLLDLSRLDRGVMPIEAVPTDLNRLLDQLLIDRTILAAQRGLTLDYQPAHDLPEALADPAGLVQIISNLVTNAVNYTPSGGVVTVTTASRQHDGADWVTFTVKDTGQGISTKELPHLFQRFYRGEVGRKATAPGTGLGLAICKELINRLGGQITVDSEPGHGAAFTVWLKQAA